MCKIAVCDDNQAFAESLCKLIAKLTDISASDIKKCTNPEDLLFFVEEGRNFDIIFMDIKFPGKTKNGIDYASEINSHINNSQIIFVTSFNEKYSQQIFLKKVNLCGYLAKPVNKDILLSLIDKAKENISKQAEEGLLVENKKAINIVPFKSISYIESIGHKVVIHSLDNNYTIYKKLDDVLCKLPRPFIRCHKSYVVNMDEVVRIEEKSVILRDKSKVAISRVHHKSTIEEFLNYNMEA